MSTKDPNVRVITYLQNSEEEKRGNNEVDSNAGIQNAENNDNDFTASTFSKSRRRRGSIVADSKRRESRK